jgi:hypothetical protein
MLRYDVHLDTLESIALAVVRREVPRAELGSAVQDGCGRAWAFARRQHLKAGHNVAVYWDGRITLGGRSGGSWAFRGTGRYFPIRHAGGPHCLYHP